LQSTVHAVPLVLQSALGRVVEHENPPSVEQHSCGVVGGNCVLPNVAFGLRMYWPKQVDRHTVELALQVGLTKQVKPSIEQQLLAAEILRLIQRPKQLDTQVVALRQFANAGLHFTPSLEQHDMVDGAVGVEPTDETVGEESTDVALPLLAIPK